MIMRGIVCFTLLLFATTLCGQSSDFLKRELARDCAINRHKFIDVNSTQLSSDQVESLFKVLSEGVSENEKQSVRKYLADLGITNAAVIEREILSLESTKRTNSLNLLLSTHSKEVLRRLHKALSADYLDAYMRRSILEAIENEQDF